MSDNPKLWPVQEWVTSAGIGRTFFYKLPAELAPRQVTVGKRRLVVESPREWGERIARADSIDLHK